MAKSLKQKDLNLLIALDRANTVRVSPEKQRLIRVGAVLLAIVLIAVIFFFVTSMKLNSEKKELLEYLDNPKVISEYEDAKKKQDVVTNMEEQTRELEKVLAYSDSYPRLASDDIARIYGFAGNSISIKEFEYNQATGFLTITAESVYATGISTFVSQLRASSMFTEVEYASYKGEITSEEGTIVVGADGSVIKNNTTKESFEFVVSALIRKDA